MNKFELTNDECKIIIDALEILSKNYSVANMPIQAAEVMNLLSVIKFISGEK